MGSSGSHCYHLFLSNIQLSKMDNLVGRYNCRYFCVLQHKLIRRGQTPKSNNSNTDVIYIDSIMLLVLLPILYKASIQHQVSM